jgi:hypothetical protein
VTLVGKVAEGINKATDAIPGLGSAISSISTVASLYAALRIGASLSGLTRIIKLIKDVRKATAVTGAVDVATGAGSAAAGGAAAGGATAAATRTGVTAAIVSKLPIAAIGAAIAAAIAAAIPKTKAHRKLTDFFDFDKEKLGPQIAAVTNFNKQLDRLNAIGDKRGADKLADQFFNLKKAAHGLASARDIDKVTTQAKNLADEGGTMQRSLNRSLDRSAANFRDYRRTGSNTMTGLKQVIGNNMADIKRTLGEDSAAGKEALARNFRLARTAIRQAMQDGQISVKDGLAEIQRLMRAELKQYGITGGVASSIIKHGNIKGSDAPAAGHARGGWVAKARRAVGGWIGRRGMVSGDVVPIGPNALAAYGEYDAHGPGGERAILNRHQAPIAEAALAAGGYPGLDHLPSGRQLPVLERALAPMGGLDRLFQRVTRPHYMADGGKVGLQSGGQHLSKGQLEALWVKAGGDPSVANIMAAIALAESGGIPSRNNADRPGDGGHHIAAGLWQILGLPFPGNVYDPLTNARMAVAKYKSQGFGAWEVYTNGAYRQYLGGGAGATSLAGIGGGAPVQQTATPITAPRTGLTGMLGTIVQATLDRAAVGATRHVQSLLDTMAPTGGGAGGAIGADPGGPDGVVRFQGIPVAAWIASILQRAMGEGVPIHVSSGFRSFAEQTVLWNRLGRDPEIVARPGTSNHEGSKFPRGAVDLSSGSWQPMAAWLARHPNVPLHHYGSPRDPFHFSARGNARGGYVRRAAGGLIERFAGGGRKRRHPIVRPHVTASAPQPTSRPGHPALQTARLSKLQVARIADYDQASAEVADLETAYGQRERYYNLTDEILVDPDTGQVNVDAVMARAAEIQGLIDIRNQILRAREKMRAVADRIVSTYRLIIGRLKASLTYAKRKDRSGIKSQISQYQDDLTNTWLPNLHQVITADIPDTKLDILELSGEKASILGTQAQPQAADTTGGGDTAGVDTAAPADAAPAPPTAADIAAAAYQDVQAYLGQQRDLLTSFASNAVTPGQAFGGGGVFSGSPDLQGGALGALRGFGGGANLAGSLGLGGSGPTVGVLNVNFQQPPDNAPTLISQLRFQVENGGVG